MGSSQHLGRKLHREGVTKACGNTRSSMMIERVDENNGM